jgi:protein-tyrosine phosphatase
MTVVTGSVVPSVKPLAMPSVLFVCTANICRSPMAEGLLRKHIGRLRPDTKINVASAGQRAGGSAIAPMASAALASYGIDMSSHTSRRLVPTLVDNADLIVTMTSEHMRSVVDLVPHAWSKTFMLTELCRRIALVAPRGEGELFARYLARLHQGRIPSDLLAAGTADDITDPYGGPMSGYQQSARDLDRYTTQVACAILGVGAPLIIGETVNQPVPRAKRGLFFRRSK